MSTKTEFVSAAGEWTQLSLHNSMGSFFHHARHLGLSPMHLGALLKMGKEGVNRVADLGGDFGVTRPAVSQMLDRLVALGLVTRTEGPVDRRAKRIELTESGKQTVSKVMFSRHEWIERIAELMSEEEITICTKAFKILSSKARELEERQR